MSRNYTITIPDQFGVGGSFLTDQTSEGLKAILEDIRDDIYGLDERVATLERGFHSTTTTSTTTTSTSSSSTTSTSSSTTSTTSTSSTTNSTTSSTSTSSTTSTSSSSSSTTTS